MDIEKLKQDLLKEAQTLSNDFDSFCKHPNCNNCELKYEQVDCVETIIFIALCDAYALGADKQSVSHDIDKILKELFPKFYEHITKRELEP